MDDGQYLPQVREQYEAYPFPPRDPEDERQRLIDGYIDHAPLVNHYCFGGRQSFENVRVLIAGGGTGDATIFWAEQLRDKGSEVVHVDISTASTEMAKARANVRGLSNITWQQVSLTDLEVPAEPFDYVNCHGVLHHLKDPPAGLKTLFSVLGEKGAAGLLLYGKYGRLALYHVQELVRRFGIHDLPIKERIEVTRKLMESLPETSWYKRGPHRNAHAALPDNVFFDSYLHPQDRAYNIEELYELVDGSGFQFVEFCNAAQRVYYRPETFLKDKSLLELVPEGARERHAVAELIGGEVARHEFYVAKQSGTVAVLDNMENVPFFFPGPLEGLPQAIAEASDGRSVNIDRGNKIQIRFRPRKYTERIIHYLDGRRSLAEIFTCVRADVGEVSDQELLDDFRPTYDVFNRVDILLLRHKSIAPFLTGSELQSRVF